MARIGEFVDRLAPVAPETLVSQVYDRLQAEPETLVLAVVDDQHRVVGLVERNAFSLRLAAEYGRALFAKRPITVLMQDAPVVMDVDRPAEQVVIDAEKGGRSGPMAGFVVTEGGRYLGVGTSQHILRAGLAIHRQRADEMSRLAENLAWAEAEAVASSRAKSQFLAVMSHEIRTPLNGVLGVAQYLERRLEAHELRPYARTIMESGEGLLRLLTDALDLSRAEAGALALEERPFAVAALLSDIQALWSPCCEQKGLGFELIATGAVDRWAHGDSMRIKQIFNNLIGNALKFTTVGAITVALDIVQEGGCLRFRGRVTDTGPGVPDDVAPRLFQPFSTGAGQRQGAGAGLGLSICRELVERMDGVITLQPGVETGASFEIDFVLFEVPAQAAVDHTPAAPTHHETLHVLVVDDNPTNRLVASTLLETFGCTTEVAENGALAVEAVSTRPFDLVLMDIKMPVMDGVTAAARIRALPGDMARVPIIALTANADPSDQKGYLDAGMDGVVEKPIKAEVLLDAVRRALTPSEAARSAA